MKLLSTVNKFSIACTGGAVGNCGDHEYITHAMADNPHQYNLGECSTVSSSRGPVRVYVCDLFLYVMQSTYVCVFTGARL